MKAYFDPIDVSRLITVVGIRLQPPYNQTLQPSQVVQTQWIRRVGCKVVSFFFLESNYINIYTLKLAKQPTTLTTPTTLQPN